MDQKPFIYITITRMPLSEVENGRYFLKFKGEQEREQFKETNDLLCDALFDVDKVYMTKEEYDNFNYCCFDLYS